MNTRDNFYRIKVRVLSLLLWLTGFVTAFSQDYIFDTEIINVEDGLPHRMTYYVLQDKEGFIWVNTQGAISRYNGYGFKTYNASFLNIEEIKSAEIAIDAASRLWYYEFNTTDPMSGVIDTAKDSIFPIESISAGLFTAKDILHLGNTTPNNNEVFIATRSGVIYKYDNHLEEICRLPPSFSEHLIVRKAGSDNSYWIAQDEKIFRVKNKKFVKTINLGMSIRGIIKTTPKLIVQTAESTNRTSLRQLENDTLVAFPLFTNPPKDMKRLLRLHEDYICYASEDAIVVRDKEGNLLYHFDEFAPAGRTENFLPGLMMTDRQDILWITSQNGLVKFTARKNPFKTLLPGSGMRGIFKDKGILWAGGGLFRDAVPDTIRTEQAFFDPRAYDAMSFYKDLNGHLWIGTEKNKIVQYIPENDTYIDYEFDYHKHSLQLPFQNPITRNYFIGTNKGLFRFDNTNQKIMSFPLPVASSRLAIRQAYQNTQGIWLASDKGIFLMDGEKETILKHYTTADGLPTNSIFHIHEDKNGIFWLGTSDAGLVRWDMATNSFRQYTRDDELSNNKIYAVYEDDYQILWLPSDYGLMAFDKNTATTRVYLPKDGIAHEEFNRFSHFQDTDGTLYFGGLNGITQFHPAALRKTATTSSLHITRVKILEKDHEIFTDKTSEYNNAQEIMLKPNDRILELDLTLLDYEKSSKNQYAYRFRGTQEQWIYTRDNKLSIINPPYGKYDLEIKARGVSGGWLENLLVIPMHVKLPFYRQWWFILALILMSITGIFVGVRWRVQKLRSDRSRLEAEVQKRTRQIEQDKKIIEEDKRTIEQQAEELKVLDKAKTRFFANITHEFRTPLTLVAGPIEQIIAEKPPESIKKRLNGVLKNTRNLMSLINQLLDLSKLEGGRMKVEVSHGDIVRYTKELVQRFQSLAINKQLLLKFQASTPIWKTHFDSDKWTKIVYNLLSNAVKFTPKGGSIDIHLKRIAQEEREHIRLRVKDSGIGIASENIEHIFNRFYQADASSTRLQGGTGIGLSLVKELTELQNGTVTVSSMVDKGTEFIVTLPVAAATERETIIPVSLLGDVSLLLPANGAWIENIPSANDELQDQHNEKLELLIIEDNYEMRSYIQSCINASLYNISEASNGEEGITKAKEMVPDLIISDVMMPKKNGFEVTEAIRTHIATSHIPLILLTAKASLESRLKGLERGADAYLTKPFSPKELALRIKKLIELRKLLQQRYQNGEEPPEKNEAFEKEDSFVLDLKNYILDNISNPDLHVDTISHHFSISRMQLYRKIKALIDKPIGDYVRSVKLEAALNLLKEQQLNISEIAYTIGFSSVGNFSRAFKKAYGKNPSEIREQLF